MYKVPFDYDPLPVINTTWSRPLDFEWAIAYSPQNALLDSMMQGVKVTMNMTKVVPYANQDALNERLSNERDRPLVGIIFDESFADTMDLLPKNLKYRMRFPAELRTAKDVSVPSVLVNNWNTQNLYPPFAEDDGPRNMNESDGGRPPGYYEEKFATVQSAVSMAFIKAHAATDLNVTLQRLPYPAVAVDKFFPKIKILVLVFIHTTFLYFCVVFVQVGQFMLRMKANSKVQLILVYFPFR